jgi:hypothetical protein
LNSRFGHASKLSIRRIGCVCIAAALVPIDLDETHSVESFAYPSAVSMVVRAMVGSAGSLTGYMRKLVRFTREDHDVVL